MDIRQIIKETINKSLTKLSLRTESVLLEHPNDIDHGDYSSNVAMVLANDISENPRQLAEKIVSEIEKDLPKEIEKVEIAGPGFINFYLSSDFFLESLQEIKKVGNKYGQNETLKGKKVIIEHSQPNPFKEFHIGHLVNNIIGESLSRVIRQQGADLKVVSYHGDVGLHVAQAIWAIVKKELPSETVVDLGKAYALGAKAYANDEQAKKEITDINKKIYTESDQEISKIHKLGREISLEHFEEIFTRLGSKFDHRFLESQSALVGKKIVLDNVGKVFEESQGAIIFPEAHSGLHTRVFLTSEGIAPYEAKDLGLIKLKRDYFLFDLSINIVDVEQGEYFKVVNCAAEQVSPDLKGKLLHIPHGRLRLTTGRMSSRDGNILSGEDVLNRLTSLALERMQDREIDNREEVAEKVAIAAIKYAVLRQTAGKNIVFDEDKSLSFEGDSGPYLQYSLVRARAVLAKAKKEDLLAKLSETPVSGVGNLEREVYKFPEIVLKCLEDWSTHHMVTYLTELSSVFNTFYANERIVEKNDPDCPYRVALTECFEQVMVNGLNILGIPDLKEM